MEWSRAAIRFEADASQLPQQFAAIEQNVRAAVSRIEGRTGILNRSFRSLTYDISRFAHTMQTAFENVDGALSSVVRHMGQFVGFLAMAAHGVRGIIPLLRTTALAATAVGAEAPLTAGAVAVAAAAGGAAGRFLGTSDPLSMWRALQTTVFSRRAIEEELKQTTPQAVSGTDLGRMWAATYEAERRLRQLLGLPSAGQLRWYHHPLIGFAAAGLRPGALTGAAVGGFAAYSVASTRAAQAQEAVQSAMENAASALRLATEHTRQWAAAARALAEKGTAALASLDVAIAVARQGGVSGISPEEKSLEAARTYRRRVERALAGAAVSAEYTERRGGIFQLFNKPLFGTVLPAFGIGERATVWRLEQERIKAQQMEFEALEAKREGERLSGTVALLHRLGQLAAGVPAMPEPEGDVERLNAEMRRLAQLKADLTAQAHIVRAAGVRIDEAELDDMLERIDAAMAAAAEKLNRLYEAFDSSIWEALERDALEIEEAARKLDEANRRFTEQAINLQQQHIEAGFSTIAGLARRAGADKVAENLEAEMLRRQLLRMLPPGNEAVVESLLSAMRSGAETVAAAIGVPYRGDIGRAGPGGGITVSDPRVQSLLEQLLNLLQSYTPLPQPLLAGE